MMKNEAGVRIEEMLCQLADATRIDGEIWRAAYTLEDKIAKNILREWIEDLGLEYREDAIGNVYGRLPGTEPGTVLTGSHLDTVKNGGKYDGALGVVTGVAALGYLKHSGSAGYLCYYTPSRYSHFFHLSDKLCDSRICKLRNIGIISDLCTVRQHNMRQPANLRCRVPQCNPYAGTKSECC